MTESTQTERSQTWKLTLAYDGTDFHGWQIQPGEVTIQGELQAALGRITGESPLPQGSGRTDAGVHALGQVASFVLGARVPATNLMRALNRTLPPSIRILDARIVPDSFHARHSARAKTYEYRILRETNGLGNVCSPAHARYVFACWWKLDRSALEVAARAFVGEHDFFSFAATDPNQIDSSASPGIREPNSRQVSISSTIRTVYSSAWEEAEGEAGPLLIYRVRGNGFLHHMVRNFVGTMLDIGRGHLSADSVPAILTAHSRSAAGPTAPARGLFLHSVEYE